MSIEKSITTEEGSDAGIRQIRDEHRPCERTNMALCFRGRSEAGFNELRPDEWCDSCKITYLLAHLAAVQQKKTELRDRLSAVNAKLMAREAEAIDRFNRAEQAQAEAEKWRRAWLEETKETDKLEHAKAQLAALTAALRVIHTAVRGDEKSECWTIRKWLDERDVFNDDLGSVERLIEAVCVFAVSPVPASSDGHKE